MATQTLTGVNVPPAKTWNYLRINDITLTVPAVDKPLDCAALSSRDTRLSALEMGAGAHASAWIDQISNARTTVVVPANTSQDVNILVSDTSPYLVHDIVVENGATVTITIVETRNAAGTATNNAAETTANEPNAAAQGLRIVAHPQSPVILTSFTCNR